MKKFEGRLSELEGMILGEIGRQGSATAYAVRKAFAASPSSEISASKGAIYPAIARLTVKGLIAARETPGDKRGTQELALTAQGKRTMRNWVCDETAATGAGLDPFRSRAGHWRALPPERRTVFFRSLKQSIEMRIAFLKSLLAELTDEPDEVRVQLELVLQEARLDFVIQESKRSN